METAHCGYLLPPDGRVSDINLPPEAGGLRLLDRRVVDVLARCREQHRFLRGLSASAGFTQVAMPYERGERAAGTTKYPVAQDATPGGRCRHGLQPRPIAAGDARWRGAARPEPAGGCPGGDRLAPGQRQPECRRRATAAPLARRHPADKRRRDWCENKGRSGQAAGIVGSNETVYPSAWCENKGRSGQAAGIVGSNET